MVDGIRFSAAMILVVLVAGGALAGEAAPYGGTGAKEPTPPQPAPEQTTQSSPASPAPAAPAPSDGAALDLLRKFFAEPDATKRALLADDFARVMPKEPGDLRAMLHRAAGYPDVTPGMQLHETAPDETVPVVQYFVRVPSGYKGDSPEGWPVVIGLHGTGGKAGVQMQMLSALLEGDADKYLLVCPQSPDPGPFRFTPMVAQYSLRVLADVRRRYNVNSDRVVLTGYSMGGYTTWCTVMFSPGEWAGAAPMACFPLTDAGRHGIDLYAPNVLPLAVQYHWGDKDSLEGEKEGINTFGRMFADRLAKLGAKKFEPLEYKGEGHSLNLDREKVRRFVGEARRDALPIEFTLIFHHLWEGRAWCVRATAAMKKELDFKHLPPVEVTSPDQVESAVEAMFRSEAMEIAGKLRPGDNALALSTRNIREVEIELPLEKLDFSRPVKVSINTRVAYQKKTAPDVRELLETARTTRDLDRLVALRMKLPAGR